MKKLLSIAFLLMMSTCGFGQLLTNKINNTAVIYAANSSLIVNGNDFVSNLSVRGFIFQTGVAGVDGSSNLFRASTNTFTGLLKAQASGNHGLASMTFSSATIAANSSSAILDLAGGVTSLGVRITGLGLTVTNSVSISNSLFCGPNHATWYKWKRIYLS